jgi:uroporphyrinogen-III decarboxylase
MANTMGEMIHGMLYGKGFHVGHLTGLGRVVATMAGAHADTVAFMGPQIHDHAMRIAGVPAARYYREAELLVSTQMAVERWYGFDTYTIIPDAYNFEVEALGAKMIYSDNAMPTVDTNNPLIGGRIDLDKLGDLDPSKGRIPMAVEIARLVHDRVSGPLASGFFCSPFSLICQAMGYPGAVRALKRDQVLAKELFDFAENRAIFPYLKAQSLVGGKSATGADAWAAFPNLTPELVEQWVVPSAKRLAERGTKELGMSAAAGTAACDYCEEDPAKFDKQIMFNCWETGGKTMFIDAAFAGMGRTQDWNMEWLQEFAVTHGKKGKKKLIMASLNARFVRDSSPAQIADKVRQWIDIMGRDGKLMFFIANAPMDTPPVNIHTAVHAVRTFGRYPIAGDLNAIRLDPPAFKPFDEWLKGQPEEDVILKGREKV